MDGVRKDELYTCKPENRHNIQPPEESLFEQNAEIFAAFEPFKLLFCYIPKNGCTKLKHLFLKLHGVRPEDELESVHQSFYASKQVHAVDMQPSTQEEILTSSSWIRAAILRDPLERFVSAYTDKIVNEDENLCWLGFCSGERFTEEPQSVMNFLASQRIWENELHFRLQKYFCGFERVPASFFTNFFMYGGKADLNHLTAELFDRRIDFLVYEGWDLNSSMWHGKTSHSTRDSTVHTNVLKNICQSQDVYNKLMLYLQDDYEFFKFQPPEACSMLSGKH